MQNEEPNSPISFEPHRQTSQPVDSIGEVVQSGLELEPGRDDCDRRIEELLVAFGTLEHAREKYANFYDLAPVPYLTLSPSGAILDLNQSAASLMGGERQGLIGLPFITVLEGEARRKFLDHLQTCRGGTSATTDLTLQFGDGRQVPVELHTRVLGRAGSDEVELQSMLLDASDSQGLRQQVVESAQLLLELTLPADSAGVWEYRQNTNTLYWSQEHFSILGLDSKGCRPSFELWLERMHPSDRAMAAAAGCAPLPTHSAVEFKYRVPQRDGTWHWVLTKGRQIESPHVGTRRLVGVTVDLTASHRTGQVVVEPNQALRERANALEHTCARLRLLSNETARSEERERLRLAQMLHDGLQQLLVAAKYQVGLARKRTDVPELFQSMGDTDLILDQAIDALHTLSWELSPPLLQRGTLAPALHWLGRWMLEKHNLQVEIEIDREADQLTLSDDWNGLLYRAARELLFNVVQHSGVQVAGLLLKVNSVGGLELRVVDKGCGLQSPSNAAAGPTGLGLFALEQRLAEMGGSLQVTSQSDLGTTMAVHVPVWTAGAVSPCA